jgi:NAD(P)-dependent dehydrogenase (short-subunit alcohol dehydrogenase family)
MRGRLEGTAGIVTGASQGIGRAIAIAAAREGATVLGIARESNALTELAALVPDGPGRILARPGDVRDEAEIEAAVRQVDEDLGGLSFMVNNAGISQSAPLHEVTIEDWEEIEAVNVRGTIIGCKHAVRSMLRTGRAGSIVNMGSVLSLQGCGTSVLYGTSKHAILGLTRAAATDPTYAAAGIRINCVCPAEVDSPLLERSFDRSSDPVAARREAAEWYPARRLGRPEEVAGLVVFLLSDEATLINGAAIPTDMGLGARAYDTGVADVFPA